MLDGALSCRNGAVLYGMRNELASARVGTWLFELSCRREFGARAKLHCWSAHFSKMIRRSHPRLLSASSILFVSFLLLGDNNGVFSLSTRGGSNSRGDAADDNHASASLQQSARTNAVVESYFAGQATANELQQEIKQRATNLTDFLIDTRRTLHRHPELMYQEEETSRVIRNILDELNIEYSTGWGVNTVPDVIPGKGGYGIVADIGTGEQPCVLLRADIDALPIHEETDGIESFKSRHDGKMHACGHDGHTGMLLGAAALLHEFRDSIKGTVRIMFQPAEEGGAGGKRMREEGVLEQEPKPQYAFGMHLWPT